MRDININASCAHCGELLDTNEATRNDIDAGGELDLSEVSLHVGTNHECFQGEEFVTEADCAPDCECSVCAHIRG
jgi:hypothetical protein